MRADCTCARTEFGHEPDCAIWFDDAAEYDTHFELLLDTDREEVL